MRLDQALSKIGVSVLGVEQAPNQLTLLLRVRRDNLSAQRWNQAATSFVLKAEKGKGSGIWAAEISKVLHVQNQCVKFVWRAILMGNLTTAQRLFGESVLEALRTGVEVTEAPLIGQAEYKHDPARGKMKGGYLVGGSGDTVAGAMIAPHFLPTGG